MAHPPVVIVNSDDKVVDWVPLREAWDKELIHRIVYVIVEDGDGRVLLHQRAAGMVLDPGRWDTVAGHVDVTPDYEESARIELREEGGIEDVPLDETAYFYADSPYHNDIHPKRFIKIFRVRHDGKTAKPSDDEVAATRWFTKEELRTLGTEHPEQLAVGLEICMPYILDERPKGNSPLMASAAS